MISTIQVPAKQSGPLMVEIVGLAGSGKSTLANALSEYDDRIVTAERFVPTAPQNMPFSIHHLLRSLPPLVLHARNGRPITRREIKGMLSLEGWHRVLRRQAARNHAAIILDQGPIFKLANLHGFGPEWLKCRSFANWWDRMFTQWAAALTTVVWLDAPRDILVQRILSRSSWHAVKEQSASEAVNFLSTYQMSCEHVVSSLLANSPIQVLRFDTSHQSPGQIASDVLAALEL